MAHNCEEMTRTLLSLKARPVAEIQDTSGAVNRES